MSLNVGLRLGVSPGMRNSLLAPHTPFGSPWPTFHCVVTGKQCATAHSRHQTFAPRPESSHFQTGRAKLRVRSGPIPRFEVAVGPVCPLQRMRLKHDQQVPEWAGKNYIETR